MADSGDTRGGSHRDDFAEDRNNALDTTAEAEAGEVPEPTGMRAEPAEDPYPFEYAQPPEIRRSNSRQVPADHSYLDHTAPDVDGNGHDTRPATAHEQHEAHEPHEDPEAASDDLKKPPLIHRSTSAWTDTSELSRTTSASASMHKAKRGNWTRWLKLRRRQIPAVPREREVSHEANASIFSIITFQWMTALMDVGYQRPLEANDIWLINPKRSADLLSTKVQEEFDKRVARGAKRPLLGAMYQTFKFEFLLGGFTQLVSSIIQVVNPYILRFLIQFAAEAYEAQRGIGTAPHIGKGIGLVFAVSILQLIQSSTQNQYLYRGMVNGGQARSVLITLIFDKAMRLSGRARAGGSAKDDMKDMPADIKPGSEEEKNWLMRKLTRSDKKAREKQALDEVDRQGWSNGRIINLMSVDSYRVDQASGLFHLLWTGPIEILIALILLLVQINYSALTGFALLVIAIPALAKAVKSLIIRRQGINRITDQRVSLTQEILSAVRFVKYFGWEISFLDRLEELRRREIRSIQVLLAIRNAILAVSMSMPIFASVVAFVTYALTGHGFRSYTIFSSLALFNSLRLPLNLLPMVIGQVADASVSIQRIQKFLMAEEVEDQASHDANAEYAIEMKDVSFTWERSPDQAGKEDSAHFVNPKVAAKMAKKKAKADKKARKAEQKKLEQHAEANEKHDGFVSEKKQDSNDTLVTGNGNKSPVKKEIRPPFVVDSVNVNIGRNELVAVIGSVGSGKSSLLAALAGDMRKTGGSFAINASRAFCPQYAWIQNTTVRQNVLFGKEYSSRWYNRVIDACALRPDLDMLPQGDMTEIGERGITVSGGQKQRLNIARAIYFDAEVVLMDDPLSAVDAHVGRHIMDNAICGLLADKCRVLATHQLWVLQRCDRVIWMDQGRVAAFGTFDELMKDSSGFRELVATNAQEEQEEEEEQADDKDEIADEKKALAKKKKDRKSAKLMSEEERAVSAVSLNVYTNYANAAGSILVIPLIVFLVVLSQGSNVITSLWLSYWTSDRFHYGTGIYAGTYAALGLVQALLQFLFAVTLSIFATRASKVMLHRAVTRVLRAPMSFFDTTPLGRITNRFSKDVDTMDNMLADSIRFFAITTGQVVAVFILIIAYYYYFAVALGPLLIIFLFSASYYRASAREIKRHEAVLRSHVFARFGEGVSGIATIRAYGLQSHFSKVIRDAVDEMNAAYYLTMSNQRWLSVRLDAIGIILVFVVGILVVTSRFSINPSTGGLVLSYILTIVQMLQFVVRQLAEVENNMNSTERLHFYGTQLDEEPPLQLKPVAESWPERGEIVFDNVEMRYRPGLPLVLQGLDLHVRGGERIGVVGRTGAGKSSIMGTLFRLVEICGGSIKIDGVDIRDVGLADLRSRLAIIPQDPTLFKGTIRSNLDPFGRYTDLQLWSALRQADLIGEHEDPAAGESGFQSRFHLDGQVDEEGLNFSLGQRQLMALARALVRGSQIIVCDEATSSVDMDTDQRIQRTMARAFGGKTLLCIAHRLKTIIQYDRIVVMDQGRIAEVDTPLGLYERGGIFRSMCERSHIVREDFTAAEAAVEAALAEGQSSSSTSSPSSSSPPSNAAAGHDR